MRSECEQAGLQWRMTAAGYDFFPTSFFLKKILTLLGHATWISFFFFSSKIIQFLISHLCNHREVYSKVRDNCLDSY